MKLKMMLILVLSSLLLAAPVAQAEKLLCVSKKTLKGQETVNSCLAKGERFAVVDDYGLVWVLTPEEVDLSRAFNPQAFETRPSASNTLRRPPRSHRGRDPRQRSRVDPNLPLIQGFAGTAIIVPRGGPTPSPAPAPGTAAETKLAYP